MAVACPHVFRVCSKVSDLYFLLNENLTTFSCFSRRIGVKNFHVGPTKILPCISFHPIFYCSPKRVNFIIHVLFLSLTFLSITFLVHPNRVLAKGRGVPATCSQIKIGWFITTNTNICSCYSCFIFLNHILFIHFN